MFPRVKVECVRTPCGRPVSDNPFIRPRDLAGCQTAEWLILIGDSYGAREPP